MKITKNKLVEIIRSGSIVTVNYKKEDGSSRKVNCRMGVKAYLKGGEKPYKDANYGIITVFDLKNKGYRSLKIDNIISVIHDKRTFSF